MSESESIRSRPTYTPLKFDPKGAYNLLVGCAQGVDALADMVVGAGEALRPSETGVLAGGSDHKDDATVFFGEKEYSSYRFIDSPDLLLDSVTDALQGMKMGSRVYVAGPEQFVWDVVAKAKKIGMLDEELHVEARGTFARRVACTHCKASTDNVITNVVDCSGCGLKLFVYDHFSRRLSAYMGFRVDAEIPGDIPAEVEAFR